MNAQRHAVVVGAGIGGLSAALALAAKGRHVTVLEQSARFEDVGAGIQLSPNATRILQTLGLSAPLAAAAFRPAALEMRNAMSGALIYQHPLGATAQTRYGAPYLHVHRADLHALLVAAVRSTDLIDLQLDARGLQVLPHEHGAHALTEDGRSFTADVVIGADGIKSTVRAALFGDEPPRFTGCVAWRGLVPAAAVQGARVPEVAALWMGPGAHFVHYYVRGGSLINFVAVVESAAWEAESWTERGDKNELLAAFKNWRAPVPAILAAADPLGCYKWGLFDRRPMSRWSEGCITLLGDACHPTLPFMAQGACMAIEDAAVLAECLDREPMIALALLRYEQLRRARTANIQQTSAINKRLYHLHAPAAWLRDLGAPMVAGAFAARLDALFDYDAFAAAR